MVKFTKAKPREDGLMPLVDLAILVFGYQNYISIDRGFGFIRKWSATDAAACEGRRLREGLLDKTKIVRHGRPMILKISAAILAAFPRSESVARAPCGKEAPFLRRRDPGRDIFRF